MAKSTKYSFSITQNDSAWSAEIVRRITRKKTVISKKQDGFTTEAEAKEWGEKELDAFLLNLKNQNQRHSSQRQQKADRVKAKAEAGKAERHD